MLPAVFLVAAASRRRGKPIVYASAGISSGCAVYSVYADVIIDEIIPWLMC